MPELKSDDRIITLSDARAYFGGCVPNWKPFAERHGFDWKHVVRHGLTVDELLSTNDEMAKQLVRWKYGER